MANKNTNSIFNTKYLSDFGFHIIGKTAWIQNLDARIFLSGENTRSLVFVL